MLLNKKRYCFYKYKIIHVLPFDSFFQIFKFNFLLKSNFYVIIYLNLTKNTIYQYFGYRRGSVNSANESLKQFNDDVYEIDLKALFIKIKTSWYFVVYVH
jgi:hypothetical protein